MDANKLRKQFGAELRARRRAMKLKYREAAQKGNLSIAMIRFLEIGKIEKPSIGTIRGMHEIYGIPKKQIERVYFG